ncbi:helix-turn-helix transcriptional regulator [Amylibacter sp. SFDW26]|uniref:helix-turn-helix domain-containing protein n=1 Tax=Amylibacter sp. SFDW26 TaxID=2652722 RepID=UPI0012622A18|nr:helix-turn-helix transcriptional regulator [Amylibacter sp. SFDW26]KAB7613919.1 helix-turn-helix transcriptional regulator [Amylibacter sp. SFDW26]
MNKKETPLSREIFAKRKSSGLTQQELARRVGATARTVGRWENMGVVPQVHHIIALRRELQIGIDDFEELIRASVQKSEVSDVHNSKSYEVHDFSHCLQMGLDFDTLTTKLIDLDDETIESISDDALGSHKQWVQLHEMLADCGRILVRNNSDIVGYWFFIPVKDEAYNQIVSGKSYNSKLSSKNIELLGLPGCYKIYFLDLSVILSDRNYKTRVMMLNAFFDQIAGIAEAGIITEAICAVAYSMEGEKLCEGLGFEFVKDHESYERTSVDGQLEPAKVYELKLWPYDEDQKIFQQWPTLKKAYSRI